MAFALPVRIDMLRSLANGSVSTTYAKLGSAFGHVTRVVKLVNPTDGDLFSSSPMVLCH